MINQNINVALIGNPNRENFGFNQLTGLNQQVGIIPELRLKRK
jgi:Fe2+ transport system protein B